MLMKLLGVCCAIAATSTVLVYGFGLQVQRPIAPLEATQTAPPTTPKSQAVASAAPIHAPAHTPELTQELTPELTPMANPSPQDFAHTEVATEITVSAEPVVAELVLAKATPDQVFVFWQPFRSRGSAQGFAQGLSARAEVPISVISEDTESGRQYRVVLPYDSEAQRLERLAKLESATRLEMGE